MDRSPVSRTLLCSECKKRMKCMANIHKQGMAEPQYKTDGETLLWLWLRLKSHILDMRTTGIMALNNALCSHALNVTGFLIYTHHYNGFISYHTDGTTCKPSHGTQWCPLKSKIDTWHLHPTDIILNHVTLHIIKFPHVMFFHDL